MPGQPELSPSRPLNRVLIANRGEIALRGLRACRTLGIKSVSVYSDADRGAPHAWLGDRGICIGAAASDRSYLRVESLVHVALKTGCDGIYPGYGFLSENAAFFEACESEGLIMIGPSADTIRAMGDKSKARTVAKRNGVPVVPGSETAFDGADAAQAASREVGFPLLLKARSGGGGRGMRIVDSEAAFADEFSRASREAESAFGDGGLYLERFFPAVRHIEVQVFGDGEGGAVTLGERDCSVQRRHQKLLEEAPSPVLDDETRRQMVAAAHRLASGLNYRGAGTVEFIFDTITGEFFFIEMNTRIQVEHPVTEMLCGLDLVALQFRVASGEPLPDIQTEKWPGGHAIEFRINAEDWTRGFSPSPGRLKTWQPPSGPGIRFDTAVYQGYEIPPFYDSMIGKLIIHGRNRADAITRAGLALRHFKVAGVATTIGFHQRLLDHSDFVENRIHTRWVDDTAVKELV